MSPIAIANNARSAIRRRPSVRQGTALAATTLLAAAFVLALDGAWPGAVACCVLAPAAAWLAGVWETPTVEHRYVRGLHRAETRWVYAAKEQRNSMQAAHDELDQRLTLLAAEARSPAVETALHVNCQASARLDSSASSERWTAIAELLAELSNLNQTSATEVNRSAVAAVQSVQESAERLKTSIATSEPEVEAFIKCLCRLDVPLNLRPAHQQMVRSADRYLSALKARNAQTSVTDLDVGEHAVAVSDAYDKLRAANRALHEAIDNGDLM